MSTAKQEILAAETYTKVMYGLVGIFTLEQEILITGRCL